MVSYATLRPTVSNREASECNELSSAVTNPSEKQKQVRLQIMMGQARRRNNLRRPARDLTEWTTTTQDNCKPFRTTRADKRVQPAMLKQWSMTSQCKCSTKEDEDAMLRRRSCHQRAIQCWGNAKKRNRTAGYEATWHNQQT